MRKGCQLSISILEMGSYERAVCYKQNNYEPKGSRSVLKERVIIPTPLAMNFIICFNVTFSTRENNFYQLPTVLEIPTPSLSVLLCVKLMKPNCLNYV